MSDSLRFNLREHEPSDPESVYFSATTDDSGDDPPDCDCPTEAELKRLVREVIREDVTVGYGAALVVDDPDDPPEEEPTDHAYGVTYAAQYGPADD